MLFLLIKYDCKGGLSLKQSQAFIPTTHNELLIHLDNTNKLLIQAGYIQINNNGSITYLPLAKRVLTKIENIILALYTSFTLVMMPRISALMESDDTDGIKRMITQSFNLLFAFVFPCIFFAEFYAEELVYLVAGAGYEGAVLPMRLVMPLMLVVGLEQILIVQILIPARADKQVFINSILGASCSILLNLLIVSKLQSIGSALVWFSSELAVMLTAFYFVRRRYCDLRIIKNVVKHLMAFIPLLLAYCCISLFNHPLWTKFIEGAILTLLYSHLVLFCVIKNSTYIMSIRFLVTNKIVHK